MAPRWWADVLTFFNYWRRRQIKPRSIPGMSMNIFRLGGLAKASRSGILPKKAPTSRMRTCVPSPVDLL